MKGGNQPKQSIQPTKHNQKNTTKNTLSQRKKTENSKNNTKKQLK